MLNYYWSSGRHCNWNTVMFIRKSRWCYPPPGRDFLCFLKSKLKEIAISDHLPLIEKIQSWAGQFEDFFIFYSLFLQVKAFWSPNWQPGMIIWILPCFGNLELFAREFSQIYVSKALLILLGSMVLLWELENVWGIKRDLWSSWSRGTGSLKDWDLIIDLWNALPTHTSPSCD